MSPRDWPKLPSGEVHLWGASLAEPVGKLGELLSPDEIARRDRFVFGHLRERYARGRGLLRTVLGGYLDLAPAAIEFDYGTYEKPALRGDGLHFNLSHSGDEWLLAVARDRPVGVDIEMTRTLDDFEKMALRFFAPGERKMLASLPAEERLDAFYRGWTRKEAIMKATGEGMALALDAFEVSLAKDDARLINLRGLPQTPVDWRIVQLSAPSGYAASLAAAGRDWIWRDLGRI